MSARRASEDRGAKFRKAVGASICSKGVTLVLQACVIPLAVRAMGPTRYGAYAILTSSLGWISLVGTAMSPSLTLAIAESDGDRNRETRHVTAAAFLSSLACAFVILFLGAGAIVHGSTAGPPPTPDVARDFTVASWVLAAALLAQLIVMVVEGIQCGYQETHISVACGMVGQGLTTATLAMVVWVGATSITTLVACMFLLSLAPRVVNCAFLLADRHPHLVPSPGHFCWKTTGALVSGSAAFGAVAAGQFLRADAGLLVAGRMLGPSHVACYGVVLGLLLLAYGVVSMQLGPILPAIADAIASHDGRWALFHADQMITRNSCYAIAVAVGLAGLGPQVIGMVYGRGVAPSHILALTAGAAFFAVVWEISHVWILFGLGSMYGPATVFLVQSCLTVVASVPLVRVLGVTGAPVASCVASAMIGSWALPLMLRKKVVDLRGGISHSMLSSEESHAILVVVECHGGSDRRDVPGRGGHGKDEHRDAETRAC